MKFWTLFNHDMPPRQPPLETLNCYRSLTLLSLTSCMWRGCSTELWKLVTIRQRCWEASAHTIGPLENGPMKERKRDSCLIHQWSHCSPLYNLDDEGAAKGPTLILFHEEFHCLHMVCFSLEGHGYFYKFQLPSHLSSVPTPRNW